MSPATSEGNVVVTSKSTARVPAGVEALGPLAKQVPQGFYFPLCFWVCLIAGLGLFGFIAALAVGLVQPKEQDESFRQFQFWFPLAAGPLGALFFGGLGYYCWRQMQKHVWVSPVGFAWVMPGRCELFPWEAVSLDWATFPFGCPDMWTSVFYQLRGGDRGP